MCRHKSNEIPNSTISIQSVQTLLHDSEKKIESAYNLTRTRASEFLGFMISDVDRNYREEEFHSVPIAFGLKGYSLSNKVMREMMEYVLLECHNRGLYTPVCSFDGQWYRMTVHDQNDSPLTLLQLQKEIWDCVKKLAKKDILKEITSANVVSVSDYLSLSNRVNITKCVKTIDVNKKELVINSFLVGKVKGEKTFMVSNNIRRLIKEATSITGKTKTVEMTSDEKEINSTRANDIMSSLPEEIESNLTEEVADQVIEVVSSLSKTKISGILKDDEMVDVNIEDLFSDQFPETNDHAIDENFDSNNNNDQDIEMDEDEVHKTTDIPSEEQENPWNSSEKLISESDIHNMLKAVQTTGKTKKSWDISVQEFEQKFQNANSIDKSFTKAELVLCMQPVVGKLKSKGVTCKSSLPKHELVSVMSKCLGDGTVFHNKKYKKKNPESLKSMCKKSIHKMPKLVLNSFYAENIYAEKLEDWYSSSPFGAHVNIQNQNSIKNKMWYSKPEFNSTLGHYLFLILDSYHQLCGARRLVCQNGIPAAGIKKEAFHSITKDSNKNKCGLNIAMAVDLIDKQSVEFAKSTFSPKVTRALEDIGAINEAKFCSLIYNWYLADDEPGIPVDVRVHHRLSLRDWLLEDVDFTKFPPHGSYIKNIPIVLYEGLLTNIERKVQLFPFVKRQCYNVRAISSLDIENFFGTFQEIDPRGTGVLTPQDIPTAVSVAIELLDARLNPERYA